jgi:gliding motility-associated-like protein
MNWNGKPAFKLFLIFSGLIFKTVVLQAQGKTHQVPAHKPNFSSFTIKYDRQGILSIPENKVQALPADAGLRDKIIASTNAVEIFSKRTRDSKFYINRDTPSVFYTAKSIGALHYLKNGQWLTIDERLEPIHDNIYESDHQEEPVGFDVKKRTSYVKSHEGNIYFNNWSLFGRKNGSFVLLAKANWSNVSEGDDGIRVANIFPGIDAEMRVFRAQVKTDFIIHRLAFPSYDLIEFRDVFSSESQGLLAFSSDQSGKELSRPVDYLVNGKKILHIAKGLIYAEKNPPDTYRYLIYTLQQHQLSMAVTSSEISQLLKSGDVIIDPLVSIVNSIDQFDIIGSKFNDDCTLNGTCDYSLLVPSMVGAQVTDVQYSFSFLSAAPCTGKDGSFNILSGSCSSLHWTSTQPDASGPCIGNNVTIFSDLGSSCFPPPSCIQQQIPFTFQFARSCKGKPGCDGDCIGAISPFTILMRGETVINVPVVKIASDVSTICGGTMVNFKAIPVNGGDAPIFQWFLNGLPVGTNDSLFSISSLKDQDSVFCIMTSSLISGCATNTDTSGKIIIQVNADPSLHINASTDNICAGDPVLFTATIANAGAYPQFQWLVNGLPVGTSDPSYSSNNLKNGDTVSAIMKASSACSTPVASDNRLGITVKEVPEITRGHDRIIKLGDSVTLDPQVSGNIIDFLWTPSAGLLDNTLLNPVAYPGKTTTYTLEVHATSGCNDTSTITIKVLKPFNMPNAFTPNEDGKNDIFRVPPAGLLSLKEFSVYNRWGTRVFYTNDPGKGWDGRFQGQRCDPGVYVYIVEGVGIKGEILLKGTVVLIR